MVTASDDVESAANAFNPVPMTSTKPINATLLNARFLPALTRNACVTRSYLGRVEEERKTNDLLLRPQRLSENQIGFQYRPEALCNVAILICDLVGSLRFVSRILRNRW